MPTGDDEQDDGGDDIQDVSGDPGDAYDTAVMNTWNSCATTTMCHDAMAARASHSKETAITYRMEGSGSGTS